MLQTKFKSAYILSAIIAILAIVASAGGLFLSDLYRDNTLVTSAWKGNDLVTLVVAVPMLVVALILSMRGSQRAQLVWMAMFLLVLSLVACQYKPVDDANDLPSEGTPRFFTHAEHDHITRTAPFTHEWSISSSVADIESIARYSIIQPTKAGLNERYPERIWGYGDITPFGLAEVTYDPTHHVVTSVYASYEWHPQAGSKVCRFDSDHVLEPDWLTSIDYLCDCCVLVFIKQTKLQDISTQVNPYWIGASASVQPVHIGDGLGEFVSGYWALEEVADKATIQTLHWTEGDEYGTLRWQACDWLFEIRAKGQDAGFTFEDLVFIAEDIHDQVVCK